MTINKNALLLFFLLMSIALVGFGVNGMVVSQSCCFLPYCESVNICDVVSSGGYPGLEYLTLYMGTAMFVSVIAAYGLINRK